MNTRLKNMLKKIFPAQLRSKIYAQIARFESMQTTFWRNARKNQPRIYFFLQSIIASAYLLKLRLSPGPAYRLITQANLPKRLQQTILFRLSLQKQWQKFPALTSKAPTQTDVLFVSYSAHPDLLKMCIALKSARPNIHITLVAGRDAHTQKLSEQWFDVVHFCKPGDDASLLGAIQKTQAKVIVMRFRDVVFQHLALLYSPAPLIYYPSGGFLSSMSLDFSVDPELSFEEIFEADRLMLERVQGIMHFLSDGVIDWFKSRGAQITCPSAAIFTACLPELAPTRFLPKLSAQDGEWHIVHATGVETVHRDPKTGGGAFLPVEKCRKVVQQGIHLHVYGTYFNRLAPGYAPYVELEQNSRFFHIEDNLPFDRLLLEMTRYDLAWKHWDITQIAFWPVYFDYITPNFYAYLQSGLPLLMSEKMPFREKEIALANNLGLLVQDAELSDLAQILNHNRENINRMAEAVQTATTGVLAYPVERLLGLIGPYLDK